MVWSDTTNEQGIVQDCDWWAGTNSTTYAIKDKVRNANDALRQIGALIMRTAFGETFLDDNSTDFYIVTTDLVSGEDNVRMETDVFVLERVRVKDRNGTFNTLEHVSRRDLTDDELNSQGVPTKYFRSGQTIRFSPAPNYSVTGGVELEFQKSLDVEFAASGADDRVPGFHADYHRLVPLYMARDYTAINDPERFAVIEREIDKRETKMISDFAKRNRSKPTKVQFKRRTDHIIL